MPCDKDYKKKKLEGERETGWYRRQVEEKASIKQGRREGGKVGDKDGEEEEGIGIVAIVEAREKQRCSLMA